MRLKGVLVTALIACLPVIAFSLTEEPQSPTETKASQVFSSSGLNHSTQQPQLETQRKRLSEINAALNELERKADEIVTARNALQAERSSLITAISLEEAEQEFKSSPGYLVVGIVDELTVTLLMHGHERNVRLFGILCAVASRGSYFIPQKRTCRRSSLCTM
jgi:predicted transcriptional regulator